MKTRLKNTRILITAGPTRAYIDDVRYISNYSTGAVGFEIAKALCRAGAKVTVVAGRNMQPFQKLPLERYIPVETNAEMLGATLKECRQFKPEWAVFSAAVLDFVPKRRIRGKVSSKKSHLKLDLVPAPKIIDEVRNHFPKVKRIGFKLQWDLMIGRELERFSNDVIKKKGLSALIVNFLPQISSKNHPATFYSSEGKFKKVGTKSQIAKAIADHLMKYS